VGLRQLMGQAGLAKVRAEYDIAGMVRRVEDEYRRLLEAKLKRGRVAESQSR